MATNLKDFCKNIADSIRAKEGSSDLISPMDFAQRIDNLQVGGDVESGIEYLDVSGLEGMPLMQSIMMAGLLGKVGGIIAPTGTILAELGIEQLATISAIATIGDLEVVTLDGVSKIRDVVDNFDSIPRLTKEQFYDLTT